MRKTFLRPVVMSNVLLVVVSMITVVRIVPQDNRQAEPAHIGISIFTGLQAQGRNDRERPRFTEKASLTYGTDGSGGDQSCLVWTSAQADVQLEVRVVHRFEVFGITFEIAAFGLMPILSWLVDRARRWSKMSRSI